MKRDHADGLVTYQFETLPADRLRHAIYTRLGGVSTGHLTSLNVGHSVGDDPDRLEENHARIYAHLALDAGQVATAQQVHGNRIALVEAQDGGQSRPTTDALLTRSPGTALMLRFADCQPILLYDPEHHALGLLHVGWRGTALGLPLRAVEAMTTAFGSRPAAIHAGLGPCIGPCCYQVGDDVASALAYALPDWREVVAHTYRGWWLDLTGANTQLLQRAGVRHVERARLCTACRVDEFYSHRAEGGRTGRFAALAVLEPGPGALPEGVAAAAQPAATQPGTRSLEEPTSLHPPGMPEFGERSL